jgi:hypothetical protein
MQVEIWNVLIPLVVFCMCLWGLDTPGWLRSG